MSQAISADGTTIGYDRLSDEGPVLVLVGGGLDDGTENVPLGTHLAGSFTVVNYRRRGRGDSGDTEPYAVQREIEDLAAVIDANGGRAHLFGASSGGALALEAAAAGLPIDRIDAHAAGLPTDFFGAAADAAAAQLPNGRRVTIDVPGHIPDPALLGPVLTAFYIA